MTKPQQTESTAIALDKLNVSKNINALCDSVVDYIIKCANQAIDQNDVFHFALSGGSTPKVVFERLATAEFSAQINWQKTHIWFGDERCVPAEHADSNYRMANQALLSLVDIPETNIHRIAGELEPQQAVQQYADALKQHLSNSNQGFPVFDLMMQGLGPDGHTASLFPGTAALDVDDQSVTAVYVEKMDSWRVSVTFPVLNAAQNLLFLVAGAGKAEIISDLFHYAESDGARQRYPVEMLNSTGRVEWFLDEAAASLMTTNT
jgi:6-phosphogluconolactonase